MRTLLLQRACATRGNEDHRHGQVVTHSTSAEPVCLSITLLFDKCRVTLLQFAGFWALTHLICANESRAARHLLSGSLHVLCVSPPLCRCPAQTRLHHHSVCVCVCVVSDVGAQRSNEGFSDELILCFW